MSIGSTTITGYELELFYEEETLMIRSLKIILPLEESHRHFRPISSQKYGTLT